MLLGDGYSRSPRGRDLLIQQRSKDLEGVAGQTRGFDLDELVSLHLEDRAVRRTHQGTQLTVRSAELGRLLGRGEHEKALVVVRDGQHPLSGANRRFALGPAPALRQ